MKRLMTVALVCVTGLAHAADWKIEATPDRLDGVYRKGEKVTFVARLLRDGYPPLAEEGYRIFLAVSMNGRPVTNLTANAYGDVKLSFVAPREGWVSCFAQARTPDNKELLRTSEEEPNKWRRQVRVQCGAMIDPELCRQGAPEPDDFDAYWAAERKAVLTSPANVKLVKNPDPALAGRNDCFVFSADLPGGFAGPTAQVQIPQDKSRKYPIHIFVHGTGVHAPRPGTTGGGPMPLAFRETLSGPVIGCNLNAHGYRLGEPEAFYRDLDAGALKDYQFQRSESDGTWYMKGLALRLIRTIDELCKLPEWDGRNVIVSGGSQGGAQALIAGGLDRRVNFVAADVPAMCDFGGELAGHAAGWPRPYHVADGRFVRSIQFADQVKTAVPDDESCVRRFGYMDAVNFAARINPDAFVAITTGGYDGVCPPTGVFAAYWRCPARTKTMQFAPLGGHCQGDYLDGQLQLPAEWRGTVRVTEKEGFDPVITEKDGVRTMRLYAYDTYAGAGRNRSWKYLVVDDARTRTLYFTGTKVEFVSNGISWDAAQAELWLDGRRDGALKTKLYRHQRKGVRTVIAEGCPNAPHTLMIRVRDPFVWANLGLGEIVVTGPVAQGESLTVEPGGLTFAGALERIRGLRAKGESASVRVKVRGVNRIRETLVFGPEDHDIAFVGEDGAVLSGGVALSDWKDIGGGVWEAEAPQAADGRHFSFDQLWVNGRRAARARYPDEGYLRIVAAGIRAVTNDEGCVTYVERVKAADERFGEFAKLTADELSEAQLCAVHKWSFARRILRGFADGMVETHSPSDWNGWQTWNTNETLVAFENVPFAFDAPGEWLSDMRSGRIRYRPLPGERMESLEAVVPVPGLSRLVDFRGRCDGGRIRNVSFRNISFLHAAATRDSSRAILDEHPAVSCTVPDDGRTESWQHQAASGSDGAITLQGAEGVSFEGCTVAHTGNYAFRLNDGCVSNAIVGCALRDLGAGGVWMGEGFRYQDMRGKFSRRIIRPDRPESTAFNLVSNCTIICGGRYNPEGTGVAVTHCSDSRIVHNDIGDFYYTGVSVGWTWGYSGSVAQRNEIGWNRIWDLGKRVMSDMGGVYTLATSFGTRVHHNLIHDVWGYTYGGWALYTDEGSEGIVMEDNICWNTTDGGFHQHYGVGCIIRNNVFAFNRERGAVRATRTEKDGVPCTLHFVNNIVAVDHGPLVCANARKVEGVWANNLWYDYRGKDAAAFGGLKWDEWVRAGKESGSRFADPKFRNPKAFDFTLEADSPAFQLGFRPFSLATAGAANVFSAEVSSGRWREDLSELTPVEFHAGELGGEFDRRIWNVATNHFLKLDIDGRFVEKFARRSPDPKEGRYEGVGKLLDAAVKLSAYTGDAQVRARTRELFEKLVATQDADGYIGFWQRTENEGQFYANWTCHEMEYLLIAFCDYARTFGDAKARAAAVRLGEYLYRVFPRDARSAKLMIAGYAEAFIDLYRLTGERKYLDYAATIPYTGPSFGVNQPLRGWTQDFGPWNGNHSYTCLARAFAASEIAHETGETDILKTPQVLKELLSEPGKGPLFLTGGCSVGEHLQRNQNGCDQCQETCASAYFILFLDSCLRRDGDFANADLIERVVWNALFGANSPDGRRIRYHTAICGARTWDEHDDGYCCCGNFRRAIGDLPARLCYKLPDGSLAVSLYAPFKKTFDLGGRAFGLRCETKYPADGTVDYVFEDDVELTLAFRVPAWCEGMTAEVNGEGAKPVVRGANALASVARRWARGDRLRLRMPMPWRVSKGTAGQAGRIAVERGPLVYCLGTARNPEMAQTKHSFRGLTLDPASISAPYPDATVRPGGTAAKARVRLPEEGWREAVLTEFADPSGRETYFYTPREKSGAKLVVTPGTNGCCVAGKPGANLVFIRGRGEPGRTLHAVFGPYTQDVKADEKGDWTACMDIRRHGKGPFDLTVTDGESELVFRKQEVR